MYDMQDLNRAWADLDARADAHPLPDGLPPVRRSRGRRVALMAASSAVVVAAGVTVAVWNASSPQASTPAPPSPTQHALSQSHAHTKAAPKPADDGPGWTTLPTGHYLVLVDGISGASIRSVIGVGNDKTLLQPDDQYQEVQIIGPPNGLVVKVNAPGSWAPSGGQQLTFDGRDAYYGIFLRHPEIAGHPVPPRMSLAWQYEPGAWATIGTLTDEAPISLDDAEHYASLIKFGVGDPLPDPLRQDK